MFQTFLAGLITLAASNCPISDGIVATTCNKPDYVVADQKPEDRDRDPGKEITDDPHGPGPHGRNPHDQIHDDKLPANDPDTYLGDS